MRQFTTLLAAGLAASGALASSWFPGTKAVYNKWHETELERWLDDHDIPHSTPAERHDLEVLIEKNWNDAVVEPYSKWDADRLSKYLQTKGAEVGQGAEETKESLLAKVKANWLETGDNASQAWANVKDWILDTWTDSQLKAFCDKHGIPVPQPRQRDTLLQKARSGYESAAKKLGESAAYPGDWLYASWSDSDFKSWLDANGIPAPQPTTRDKLVASVRRNSRLAYLQAQQQAAKARANAQAVYATVSDKVIDAWGESELKDFCDKNSIPVPQGTRVNELRALVRKHRAEIMDDTVGAKASLAFGAATSNAQNEYAKATDSASLAAQDAFDRATEAWSDSRLKSYLDARGIPVPHSSTTDELRALVRKNVHKITTGGSAWTYDDLSREKLQQYLAQQGDAAAKTLAEKKDATREELVSAAQSAYSSASTAGGEAYASATSYLAEATAAAKNSAFDTWTETDLKAYLDSYGVPVPQGSKLEELKALARKQSTYFKYGTSSPSETLFAKLEETARGGWNWIAHQLNLGGEAAREKAAEAEAQAKAKAEQLREEL
ncbi:hypothetical protein CDD82_4323 [Ophiocordyceps australis]|uniref:Meiotic sister chromatid recombination protein 1 n=1 Tax=Ophiocordyceps australis TaxID=1399860 RepID=A0A2C5YCA0_9HYPO|nr:hypothetical protein CDD82_4323 [Ophiocordyceps australis]